ncbi:hypothetical protein [Lutibacter citreus]|uniref:hypothetical protein n=1 Tax=Lutibacter citreus TaxID=2138210 RepID=UPI000DBE4FA5|nr:hypothetical protein [Lutibacter citreus]
MALLNCFDCKKEISITAISCPECGFELANYFKTNLSNKTIGVPLSPILYWENWHLGYFMKRIGKPTNKAWVNKGDPIYVFGDRFCILSPISGRLVNYNKKTSRSYDIKYFLECKEFIEIQPLINSDLHEEIVYSKMRDYLIDLDNQLALKRTFWIRFEEACFGKQSYPLYTIDCKRKFNSKEALFDTINDLDNVKCITF